MPKKFVLVAIGGSGMRVAQSVVTLAASGFLTDLCECDYKLEIRLVDLDIVPDSDKTELEKMIEHLNAALPYMSVCVDDGTSLENWKPKGVDASGEGVQTFKVDIRDNSTLGRIVLQEGVTDSERLLFDALYCEEDREMELRRGCKGKPRIGSLLWAERFDRDWKKKDGFWRGIFDDIAAGDELRIMFAGSVFGGTGASGTPTLAQKYRVSCIGEKDGNIAAFAAHVGLTLMLPYFEIGHDTDVDSTLFTINSKMALKYYEKSGALDGIEFTQFVGDGCQQMQKKNSEGEWKNVRLDKNCETKQGQNDPSMPAELMAAVGICRFFSNDIPNKIYVPKKWENSKPEYDVPSDVEFSMTSFDYFPVTTGNPTKGRIKSLMDYILRLERFSLMLGTYYRTIAVNNPSWPFRPEVFRTVWKKRNKKIDTLFIDKVYGVGVPLEWAADSYRWLEELDKHGLHALLGIGGKPTLDEAVKGCAECGSTDFQVCGIPCADITSAMNSIKIIDTRFEKDEAGPAKSFISSLMECCIEHEKMVKKVEA